MSQSIVENNRAVSQWNPALGCGQGKSQSKRTVLKPLSSQVSVHMPKGMLHVPLRSHVTLRLHTVG